MPPKDSSFWKNYDPDKHMQLVRAMTQKRLVVFMIVYLSVTTSVILGLIIAAAMGKTHLSDSVLDKLTMLTIGQFAGATMILYRYMFRQSRN
jgi:hypothetical protein